MTEHHPKARSDGLIIELLGDEFVIYDEERDKAHALNPTAASVFRHADGQRDVDELCEAVAEDLGKPAPKELVLRGLAQLAERGLLEPSPERSWATRPLSRKEMIAGVGAAGVAAVVAIPAVRSIVAPTPAQAQTCLSLGAVCGSLPVSSAPATVAQCSTTGFAPCCSGLTCFDQNGKCVCNQPVSDVDLKENILPISWG